MSSKIESEILVPEGLLAITGLDFRVGEIFVNVSSWEEPKKSGRFHFPDSRLKSLHVTYSSDDLLSDPDFLQLPWDTLSFGSDPLGNGRWSFTIVTDVVEIGFEAEWPLITKL